jgi:hypothetical protein
MILSAHTYLNQIFYKHKKFDDGANIIELEPWMLVSESLICVESVIPPFNTKNNITFSHSNQRNICESNVKRSNNQCYLQRALESETPNITDFRPVNPDSLFWCAYAVHHGEAGYWAISNKYKNAELLEKQKIVDFISRDQHGFKKRFHKMSNVGVQEIMAELMIDKKTSWKTFFAMCVYYGFRAIVVYENTYLDFSPISEGIEIDAYLFHTTKEGHISVITTPLCRERLTEIGTTHICLGQNPDKPFKAASNYKVDELIDLAERVGIDVKHGIYNKWKKADWYDSVINKCKWN